ncbi:MAG: formate dehydrogenase accessory sulfurtransferase FdhD [Synergistaceae bacterium]|nr:formate dehydrogenase accessory sulfurtransferase FdhD [Synergistota bacterium]NLM72136.1 formate dehydrogenase accessory sulfurtransferase FdhD [Synergistaceae bacterium]
MTDERASLLSTREILRIEGGKSRREDDSLLRESRVTLVLDGVEEVTAVCTAGHEDFWAVGHLKCRRLIEHSEDVRKLDVSTGVVSVVRSRRLEGLPCPRRLLSTSESELAEGVEQRLEGAISGGLWIRASVLREGAAWLAEAPIFRATGGTHVAALVSVGGERLFMAEDIGRHNAVDKVVGWAVMNGAPLGESAILVSGRLPLDMVVKALAAGIPFMGSVSAATADGAEAAERGGMVLAGFVRGERMNVYTLPGLVVP